MRRAALLLGTVVLLAAVLPGSAAAADLCLTQDPPPVSAPPKRLGFGVMLAAGTAGATQGHVAPESLPRTVAALAGLQPPGRRVVVRINRVFQVDGAAGLRSVADRAEAFRRAGLLVDFQIRYHPAAAQNGDIPAFGRYVRQAVRALSGNPAVVAMTITNEVNLPLSSNTSDGSYKRGLDAIVGGVEAAHSELSQYGRNRIRVGFTFAYRYLPNADANFWTGLGKRATPRFRRALDFVGLQLYPGLFWPPVLIPGQSAAEAALEGITLLRRCWLPEADLGRGVPIWLTEFGFATNLGHTEARQDTELRETVEAVRRYSGTLGVEQLRYANLRDNRPNGTDLFDDIGLLRADYSRKPAYATLRDLIARYGRPATCARRVRLRKLRRHERYRRVRARLDGKRIRARLVRGRHNRRYVAVAIPAGRHTLRLALRTSRHRLLRPRRKRLTCT